MLSLLGTRNNLPGPYHGQGDLEAGSESAISPGRSQLGPGWVLMSPEVIPGHHPESPHTWQHRYYVAIMEQRGRGQLANGAGLVPQATTIGSRSSPSFSRHQIPAPWGPQSGEQRTAQQLAAAILRMACCRMGVGRPARGGGAWWRGTAEAGSKSSTAEVLGRTLFCGDREGHLM